MNPYFLIILIFAINLLFTIFISIYEIDKLKRAPFLIILMIILPLFGYLFLLFFLDNRLLYRKSPPEKKETLLNIKNFSNCLHDNIAICLDGLNSVIADCSSHEILDVAKFYDSIIEDISKAEKLIYLSYYGIKKDSVGRRLIKTLEQKSNVRIAIIYDSYGSRGRWLLFRKLKKKGAIIIANKSKNKRMQSYFNHFYHKKLAVIDDVAYIGSTNFDKKELSLGKINDWTDSSLRVTGDIVQVVANTIIDDFKDCNKNIGDRRPVAKGGKIALVSSNPGNKKDYIMMLFLTLINNAKKSIDIITPFLSLNKTIIDALKLAINNNVKIRIILPEKKDSKISHASTFSYIKPLLDIGVEVYLSTTFNHTKLIIIDNVATTYGSANFQYRSFYNNYEANAVIFDQEITNSFVQYFAGELEKSLLVEENVLKEKVHPRGFFKKLIRLLGIE